MLRPLGEDSYELCCNPFCAYGLALGDIVSIDATDSVGSIVQKSGRRVLRCLLAPDELAPIHFDRIIAALRVDGLLFEARGGRQVAIDFPTAEVQWSAGALIEDLVGQGHAFWEWADMLPFE